MAELKKPEINGFRLGPTAPSGAYIATCLDIQDQFGVERPKFENPSEMETLDVTRFLFGFKAADGQIYKVQTYEMRISGNPKSNTMTSTRFASQYSIASLELSKHSIVKTGSATSKSISLNKSTSP